MLRLSLALLVLAACGESANSTSRTPPPPPPTPTAQPALTLQIVASGLGNPLYLTAPAGDARLFVVEQGGRIRVIQNGSLLSMAFHPRYAENGYFYVDYTDLKGNTRVERYRVSPDPNRADPASAKLILHVDQPYPNHNGGLVLFGQIGNVLSFGEDSAAELYVLSANGNVYRIQRSEHP